MKDESVRVPSQSRQGGPYLCDVLLGPRAFGHAHLRCVLPAGWPPMVTMDLEPGSGPWQLLGYRLERCGRARTPAAHFVPWSLISVDDL